MLFILGFDKILHFIAGVVIAVTVTTATGCPPAGIWAGVAIGVGKEIYDGKHPDKHTKDAKDALATVAGSIITTLI